MNKIVKSGIGFCLIVVTFIILTGCAFGKDKQTKQEQASNSLKVMSHGQFFYQDYGMLFSAVYPDIEIEVIDINDIYPLLDEYNQDYNKAMEVFVDREQPDVIVFDPTLITPFIENGALYELDSLIAEESYNADGLAPGVLDIMREIGSGKVYSIPTSFTTNVVYYNKTLFDQYNVAYPTDQMTWKEFIALANQFPTEGYDKERLYGMNMAWSQDLSDIVNQLSQAEGLNYFDNSTLTMTIDTPAWASIIEQANTIPTSDAFFFESCNNSYLNEYGESISKADLFQQGKIAMILDANYYIDRLIEAEKEVAEDEAKIVWDIVTAPVNENRSDSTGYTYFYNLLSINAKSQNIDAAKTFISYITGDEYARVISNLNYTNNSLRMQFFNKYSDYNYSAFYKLKPFNNFISYHHVPQRFLTEFFFDMQEALTEVAQGGQTIDQAIAKLQIRGNELLATDVMSEEEFNLYLQQNENQLPGVILE